MGKEICLSHCNPLQGWFFDEIFHILEEEKVGSCSYFSFVLAGTFEQALKAIYV